MKIASSSLFTIYIAIIIAFISILATFNGAGLSTPEMKRVAELNLKYKGLFQKVDSLTLAQQFDQAAIEVFQAIYKVSSKDEFQFLKNTITEINKAENNYITATTDVLVNLKDTLDLFKPPSVKNNYEVSSTLEYLKAIKKVSIAHFNNKCMNIRNAAIDLNMKLDSIYPIALSELRDSFFVNGIKSLLPQEAIPYFGNNQSESNNHLEIIHPQAASPEIRNEIYKKLHPYATALEINKITISSGVDEGKSSWSRKRKNLPIEESDCEITNNILANSL